ncbi:hypothetical protein DXG01_010544 [Tephrocybe rancida]|nr:hypothetical protein DXG01_010544 [Tephrocybe rancida]
MAILDPPDDVLKESLHQYAREKLTVQERINRLHVEHGLDIKKSKLMQLNNTYNVPSVQKLPPGDVAVQAVLDQVAKDPAQRNGVGAIGTFLSTDGMPLPRDFIRDVLSEHAPEGLALRFPGVRGIKRKPLDAIGPFHQDHSDGHDKLNAQALRMGEVCLPIYGIKDQYTSFVKHLVTVPNNRLATTIGHVHLDCIDKYQAIPITSIVDQGSELGYFYANQTALRTTYAPDIDKNAYPPMLQVRSTHNTPIEGLWNWFQKTTGRSFQEIVREGFLQGRYNPNSKLHVNLFNWLWPKILQNALDDFTKYWNNHRIRKQADKNNVSGTTPTNAFIVPETYGGKDCRIKVDLTTVDALRKAIPVSREDAMRWVEDEFSDRAQLAYVAIGSPGMEALSGWNTFSHMITVL